MLKTVKLASRPLADYRSIIDDDLYDQVLALAMRLAGKRILQISATANGGGVAEMLHPEPALCHGLGLAMTWQVLDAHDGFFAITKHIHNGLQGGKHNLTAAEWQRYEDFNKRLARAINPDKWDYVIIHDPQPAAVRQYIGEMGESTWLWRYHGDSSHPNPSYAHRMRHYLAGYDAAIFTMAGYRLPGYRPPKLLVVPPAIDPLSPKNLPMALGEARRRVAACGVDPLKPLITQISRFDPWKDPLGVVKVWRLARKQIPDLQLALVGDTADDDPEGAVVLAQVREALADEPRAFIVTKCDDRVVKAFQTAAQVVLQKSLREGFGLTVTEALWAGRPVIGGNVGGIRLQLHQGVDGYLVDNLHDAARYVVRLVRHPSQAGRMGRAGRELVRHQYLLPRLVRDNLAAMLASSKAKAASATH
jgi:trehalose synthase